MVFPVLDQSKTVQNCLGKNAKSSRVPLVIGKEGFVKCGVFFLTFQRCHVFTSAGFIQTCSESIPRFVNLVDELFHFNLNLNTKGRCRG